jgi:hypothetical protein
MEGYRVVKVPRGDRLLSQFEWKEWVEIGCGLNNQMEGPVVRRNETCFANEKMYHQISQN